MQICLLGTKRQMPRANLFARHLEQAPQKLSRLKWINPAPILVIQPEMDLVLGVSEIEHRALLELGESVGARQTFVHYGGLLTDRDVVALVGA